ncbi:MAG: hypothetical protein WAN50_00635 [Minisyncoccia bacterium]
MSLESKPAAAAPTESAPAHELFDGIKNAHSLEALHIAIDNLNEKELDELAKDNNVHLRHQSPQEVREYLNALLRQIKRKEKSIRLIPEIGGFRETAASILNPNDIPVQESTPVPSSENTPAKTSAENSAEPPSAEKAGPDAASSTKKMPEVAVVPKVERHRRVEEATTIEELYKSLDRVGNMQFKGQMYPPRRIKEIINAAMEAKDVTILEKLPPVFRLREKVGSWIEAGAVTAAESNRSETRQNQAAPEIAAPEPDIGPKGPEEKQELKGKIETPAEISEKSPRPEIPTAFDPRFFANANGRNRETAPNEAGSEPEHAPLPNEAQEHWKLPVLRRDPLPPRFREFLNWIGFFHTTEDSNRRRRR